ncbi:MAG: hypothetical protein V2I63_11785 [Pseudomonadales bacterium]|nr:hypothetical protein [Pseudomonadales bacterium]
MAPGARVGRLAALCVCLTLASGDALSGTPDAPRWWKGNTHTHSWWSDGDAPPELIALWYAERGYDFLVFSEHNVIADGEAWYPLDDPSRSERKSRAVRDAYARYRTVFGDRWVVDRRSGEGIEVRLKPLDEFRALFERAGEFILIQGEEITSSVQSHPVHMNGVNLVEHIDPLAGESVAETLQLNLDAVRRQADRFGRPMLMHVNHPNFHFAMQAEDFFYLDHAPGDGFFEMYNGHPGVGVNGDFQHMGTERMWDVILSWRLGPLERSVLYGVAVDDAHEYTRWGPGETNPGRGWVMVRATHLTPDSITAAMRAGDFYNSTGVTLRTLDMSPDAIRLEVEPADGVNYRIEFVGTRADADLRGRVEQVHLDAEAHDDDLSLPAQAMLQKGIQRHDVVRYGDRVGEVLARVSGTVAEYRLRGDEIYVRARILSDRLHPNPHAPGDVEMAWTQPLVPERSGSPTEAAMPQ